MTVRAAALIALLSTSLTVLSPVEPAHALTAGDLVVMERLTNPDYRAISDLRGGQWVSDEHGIHRRGARPLTSDQASIMAAVPLTGDVVYDHGTEVRHLTRAGEMTVLAEVEGTITAIDVAPDGDVYVANGEHGIDRIDGAGNVDRVVTTDAHVEALTVDEDDETLTWVTGRRLYRDGELVAGDGTYCTAPDPCGDGGPALDAGIGLIIDLEIHADETIFLADLYGRVRSIRADGIIRHLAGDWERCWLMAFRGITCRENIYAQAAALDDVVSMSLEGDIMYLVDRRGDGGGNRLLRIGDVTTLRDWQHQGYRMLAADGGVFAFGWAPFHGSTGDLRLASPIVGGVSNGPGGYWFVAGDGGVFTFGDAEFFGSASGPATSPVVDMARTPTGRGYWLLEHNGRVHAFGDAPHRGNGTPPSATRSAAAIIGARSGNGYRIVRTDGTQEDRQDQIGGQPATFPTLNAPIVHARPTPSGDGLWLVASDGGVFTQGDAGFFGSTGDLRLRSPVVDLVPTATGRGYWLVAADGGVFSFGDAVFHGSMGAARLNRPVVAGVAGPVVSG